MQGLGPLLKGYLRRLSVTDVTPQFSMEDRGVTEVDETTLPSAFLHLRLRLRSESVISAGEDG